jgi:hypothetical protein
MFMAVTWILYTGSIIADPDTAVIHEWRSSSPWEPVPFRMNFLFDSDGPRIVYALTGEEGYYGEQYTYRHPLFVLFLAPAMSALLSFGISAIRGGLIISAFFGAAAVGATYLTLRKWRVRQMVAAAWTVLFAVSTPIWLFSSVVDSFSANAFCIVGVFYLAGPEVTQPRRYKWHFAGYLLFSVVAIGLTLANVVYVVAAFGLQWWIGRTRTIEDALAPAVLGLVVFGFVAGLVAIQDRVYPITRQRNAFPYSHTDLFRVDWETAPERLSTALQTLGPDALIMRRPTIRMTPSPFSDRPGQMMAFGPRGTLYWCSLLALLGVLGFAGSILARRGRFESSAPPRMTLLALGFILYNVVFAFAFDGYHGAPILFSSHVVFPIIVLLVSFTTVASRNKLFVAGLIAATVLIVGTNAKSLIEVRRLSNRPCLEWAPEDTYPAKWWPTGTKWE